eukprot:m51a1_g2930 hypothetical protein (388) ;mRNA; f:575132-576295
MLVGEWGVLHPGCSCVVLPVSRYVVATARLSPAPGEHRLLLPDIGVPLLVAAPSPTPSPGASLAIVGPPELVETDAARCILALRSYDVALSAAASLLSLPAGQQLPALEVSVRSDISGGYGARGKPGLGSSAATAVAVAACVVGWHSGRRSRGAGAALFPCAAADPALAFRAASCAQFLASGAEDAGSCFDVAASAWARPLRYGRFDPAWLRAQLREGRRPWECAEWPQLRVSPLAWPAPARFLACNSRCGASTGDLVRSVRHALTAELSAAMGSVSDRAAACIERGDVPALMSLVRECRGLLLELQRASGVALETDALRGIVEAAESAGAAAKLSGAGGGDCAIAVAAGDEMEARVRAAWQASGAGDVLDLNVVDSSAVGVDACAE